MRFTLQMLVIAGVVGMVGVANAKPKSKLDNLFATSAKSKSVAKAKPAPQPRAPLAAKSPKRASKAALAPGATPAPTGGGESSNMVLADWAPERHALAGP